MTVADSNLQEYVYQIKEHLWDLYQTKEFEWSGFPAFHEFLYIRKMLSDDWKKIPFDGTDLQSIHDYARNTAPLSCMGDLYIYVAERNEDGLPSIVVYDKSRQKVYVYVRKES